MISCSMNHHPVLLYRFIAVISTNVGKNLFGAYENGEDKKKNVKKFKNVIMYKKISENLEL